MLNPLSDLDAKSVEVGPVILLGPPGAGKTTVSSLLADMFEPSALVAGDDFFAFLKRGFIPPWTGPAHHQNDVVIRAAVTAAGRLANDVYTVVYDGVVGPWFLGTFAESSNAERLHYAMLMPSQESCVERVRSRIGHGFTDLDAARHMYHEFAVADIESRHVVRTTGDATQIALSVHELVEADSLLLTSR